ncbi:MAG TPA: acetate/propionate family kinase [Candidatus Limnocylindria bacterium]|nr:acetate/propionate family kinase [Candidatus Limnocylindria bacterium]
MDAMQILAVNAGSTSLKLERYVLAAPLTELADPPEPVRSANVGPGDAEAALAEFLRETPDAVAHRFVRLADDAPPVLRLDGSSEKTIGGLGEDAPLHSAPALRAVEAVAKLDPAVPQYAVGDSAFHRTIPPAAATYALPRELTRAGLRRIGYHGLSHEYAAHRGCALAGLEVRSARVVTAHLGGGSSLCAVRGGASIDTTMGYTPLEGLPMATRSGSVDPGLLLHLLRGGMSHDDLEETLERRSGLLGISGRSGDVRELLAAADDPDARLALDVLGWRLRAALGAMIGVLGGIDLIVFTGGVGEHAPSVRAAGIAGAAAAGAVLDDARNASLTGEGSIAAAGSRVAICVVTAREGWQLARKVYALSASRERRSSSIAFAE